VTAADLAARLDAKRVGDGWQAKCPAHEDHTPSLTIAEGHDGRALVHCHAGCAFDAVVTALGIEKRELFADGTPHTILATYDYTDAEGTVLFQVVRFAPKEFRQRRPDGLGGWTWNLNGVRRVLYHLPQLRAAVSAGQRVFIVEGEKDVAAVERAGYAATCNPGGAGKWRATYTAELRGADVMIVADQDDPGRAHARAVAQTLRGVAARVVLVLPAAGKDVSDHLAAGRKLSDLVPLADASAATSSSAADGLTHIRELLAEPDDAVSWIVDGLLPAGGLSVFGGKPKGGKSTTARAIALRVARGEPVLGRATTKGPVIYLGLEDPRRVTKGHLRTLGARAEDDLYVFTGHRPDEALTWLAGVLAKVDPVLVVVDTLQHLLGVSDLNDYARVVAALGPVLALVRTRRVHLMLVHHAGKGDRTGFDSILGSTAIVGTVDVALLLKRREDHTRTIMTLQRSGEDLPESVLVLDAHQEPRLEGTRADYDAKQVGERVLAWLAHQVEPVTRKAIEEAVEGRADTIWQAVARLVDEGRVERTGVGKRGDPFLFRYSHLYPGIAEQKPEPGQSSPNDATFSIPADATPSALPAASGNRIAPPPGAGDAWEPPEPPTLAVTDLGRGLYLVSGGREPHEVTLPADAAPSCDCPDHVYRRRECKHIVAVREAGAS
jgi:AAA domain-containing protein/Toprim domain-containing protein